jgi:hypothetical protein|tara:strand:- start:665 stop:949 length:285 start_codon:yes stop_codon:yes gene_type:complete
MNLSFEIKCTDYSPKFNPAYRVFVNEELIIERDFVIPNDSFSHYTFECNLDLPQGENKFSIQGVQTDATFTLGSAWFNDVEIVHSDGVFYNENT